MRKLRLAARVAAAAAFFMATAAARAQTAPTGQIAGVVTDTVGAASVGANPTLTSDAGAARTAATGTNGRYVVALLDPGAYQFQAVIKDIPVVEGQRVEFRAGFFNLCNNVNFADPVNIIDPSPDLGPIVSTTTGPRVIQLACSYAF